jgi:hypothetical protein
LGETGFELLRLGWRGWTGGREMVEVEVRSVGSRMPDDSVAMLSGYTESPREGCRALVLVLKGWLELRACDEAAAAAPAASPVPAAAAAPRPAAIPSSITGVRARFPVLPAGGTGWVRPEKDALNGLKLLLEMGERKGWSGDVDARARGGRATIAGGAGGDPAIGGGVPALFSIESYVSAARGFSGVECPALSHGIGKEGIRDDRARLENRPYGDRRLEDDEPASELPFNDRDRLRRDNNSRSASRPIAKAPPTVDPTITAVDGPGSLDCCELALGPCVEGPPEPPGPSVCAAALPVVVPDVVGWDSAEKDTDPEAPLVGEETADVSRTTEGAADAAAGTAALSPLAAAPLF